MKEFKPLEKLYISKNVNSKTLEEMAEYLKCTQREVKHCYETMKLNGEYDKYRVSNYETVKKEEEIKEKDEETNSLLDLNKYLFSQLNALKDRSLTENQFKQEVERSKAMVSVSQTIINNAKIMIEASKQFQRKSEQTLNILGIDNK